MTVLGNIVAVTSIIAVVSLIQGLNASVKQAILNQAGADSFNIQQFPITRSDEEFDKVRSNPRITLHDARAIRRYSPTGRARSWPTRRRSGRVTYRDKSIDQHAGPGRHRRVRQLLQLRRRARPADEPDRGRHARGRSRCIGWQTADRLFGSDIDPLDKIDPDRRRALPRRRRQRQARLAARPVAGRVRGHPARPVPDDVRIAALSCR